MDKTKKTLKSPLSAKLEGLKAKAAGEAQKSLAREVLTQVKYIEFHLLRLKILMKEIIG